MPRSRGRGCESWARLSESRRREPSRRRGTRRRARPSRAGPACSPGARCTVPRVGDTLMLARLRGGGAVPSDVRRASLSADAKAGPSPRREGRSRRLLPRSRLSQPRHERASCSLHDARSLSAVLLSKIARTPTRLPTALRRTQLQRASPAGPRSSSCSHGGLWASLAWRLLCSQICSHACWQSAALQSAWWASSSNRRRPLSSRTSASSQLRPRPGQVSRAAPRLRLARSQSALDPLSERGSPEPPSEPTVGQRTANARPLDAPAQP